MHGLRMQVHDIMTSRSHLAGPSPRDPGADGGDAAGGSAGAFAQPWFQNPRGFSAPLHHPLYGMPPAPASITKL
ncbi:hypothetical protein A0H81_11857 [Grifola frondosa]|uniref:Uncharacterized protein n=1 Tax=Grifola frondosa TaxID=5627 RepID=A0A1C7LZ16_GRIFR|nr:hypothetical protein A0H81_11857 [Grifola frondosa]